MIVPYALIAPIKHLTVPAVLAVVSGLYFVVRGMRLLAHLHRQNAPASKIATAVPGLVKVSGVATGPNTVAAPITGQSCYLYRTTVWQQRKVASHEWEKVADEILHVPFFLDDSTGQLLIEPIGVELDLQSEFHKEYEPALFVEQNKVPPRVSLFLARHGVTPARRIRIEECCIRPESVVFIAGTVTENPGVEVRSIRREGRGSVQPAADSPQIQSTDAPEVIRLSVRTEPLTAESMTLQSKISAALVKAGIRNPDAWAAAGVLYPESSPVGDPVLEPSEPRPNGKQGMADSKAEHRHIPALVLMKGPEDTPFQISWRSRRELGRSHVWQSALMLGAGAVLTFAGLYGLLLEWQAR